MIEQQGRPWQLGVMMDCAQADKTQPDKCGHGQQRSPARVCIRAHPAQHRHQTQQLRQFRRVEHRPIGQGCRFPGQGQGLDPGQHHDQTCQGKPDLGMAGKLLRQGKCAPRGLAPGRQQHDHQGQDRSQEAPILTQVRQTRAALQSQTTGQRYGRQKCDMRHRKTPLTRIAHAGQSEQGRNQPGQPETGPRPVQSRSRRGIAHTRQSQTEHKHQDHVPTGP